MMPGPAGKLRERLAAGLVQAMSSHSPLSAILAEETGFGAIWASGFELSALYGLPDASLVSMTQHLEMTRAMAARTSLPVVADIDTGFGNAINAAFAVREYELAGAAAVVIEDKSFPKMTSLIAGGRQDLVRTEEFQGKIEAALAARSSSEFVVIARTEALIAGRGLTEALARASAYEEAGADLILVHSKQPTSQEIVGFVQAWRGSAGLVIVPTTYPDMSADAASRLGKVRMLIHGNHALRGAVKGMRAAMSLIADKGAAAATDAMASVEEIFRLQGMDKLKADERRFLR